MEYGKNVCLAGIVWIFPYVLEICLATIGAAFFDASASVGALFYTGNFIQKKERGELKMEEKVLANGILENLHLVRKLFVIFSFVLLGAGLIVGIVLAVATGRFDFFGDAFLCGIFAAVVVWFFYPLVMAIVKYRTNRTNVTVTDQRVYGMIGSGKAVNLPLDSISSVGEKPLGKQFIVATSSGLIHFRHLTNHAELYNVVSELLRNRQTAQRPASSAAENVATPALSAADELKKYKELFDQGIITEEEFQAKKKQLLGL